MPQSRQTTSNVAAGVLAAFCIFYVCAPPGVFIGVLVLSVFMVSIWAWFSHTLREKKQR